MVAFLGTCNAFKCFQCGSETEMATDMCYYLDPTKPEWYDTVVECEDGCTVSFWEKKVERGCHCVEGADCLYCYEDHCLPRMESGSDEHSWSEWGHVSGATREQSGTILLLVASFWMLLKMLNE